MAGILDRKGTAGVLLGISLARSGEESYLSQLYQQLRDLILSGQLSPGERLPSSRVLADEIGVSRNTVMTVYEQLQAEGYVAGVVGSGTRVAAVLPEGLLNAEADTTAGGSSLSPETSQRSQAVAEMALSGATWLPAFSPGMPAIDRFPFATWSKLLSEEWKNPGLAALTSDPGGYWPLREHIATYVRGARGVTCEADQVIIVSGNREGTELAARVLLDTGGSAIVEEPGYAGVRSALTSAGIHLLPLEVDAEGLMLSEMSARHQTAKLLCTAPSHHYPLGGTTSLARRLAILDWCRKNACWILEDDYDSEFRYSERPLPSLQSLAPSANVIYVGTFSKTLFPSLRIGYLIVPKSLIQPFIQMKLAASGPTTMVSQRAIARFFDGDLFYRHVRTMRKLYQHRRAALVGALQEYLPQLVIPLQQDAGLFLRTELDGGLARVGDMEIARRARSLGLHVEPLSATYMGKQGKQGLIFGFGAVDEDTVVAHVKRLAGLLQQTLNDYTG
ncbi:MocR-like pyridoxine biosynthesis transcription factor PdxR [Ensifer canadensis]